MDQETTGKQLVRFEQFMSTYETKLKECVREMPEQYSYDEDYVPVVLGRMRKAVIRGSFNKEGPAFKRTCAALGIDHTYKAISKFIQEEHVQ